MKQVTAAVIEKDGKILIAQRKKGDALEGKWEFPGGKIELGETPEECLKRELMEEFEIDAKIGQFICSSKFEYAHIPIELLVYRVTDISGVMKMNDHSDIKWVSRVELGDFDFASADLPIVKILCNEENNG